MILDKIDFPEDVKKLSIDELNQLSCEMREFMIDAVSKTGGHLASNLGAVEITIALHYVFNTPKDKIVWDVGHQSYPHKILTGRKDKFSTLRQHGGMSGFPKLDESEHDAFGTGHSSTSISAALGIAKARDAKKESYDVVAVIGDGAMTGGLAFEGLNQFGYLNTKMIVLLNDNKMSISMNVGALSEYAHRIERTDIYKRVKDDFHKLIQHANENPELKIDAENLKQHFKEVGKPGLVFEKLGINYIGPVDGHNIQELVAALKRAKEKEGPVLVHVLTDKGKGYCHAENNKPRFHGVSKFDIKSGNNISKSGKTFTKAFSESAILLAENNPDIVAITAAMPEGTGLNKFQERFPDRFFDVGIAEQHAVTFAAGLATQGIIPLVAIYSTFLQRSFDQLIHDVALQNLHVVFAVDRAGIVGEDGATHHGLFDLSYLRLIPNMTVLVPKDEAELKAMMEFAVNHNGPVAVRYPRGECVESEKTEKILFGKSELMRRGKDIVLVGTGPAVFEAIKAAAELEKKGIGASVINSRFIKPLDNEIINKIQETGKAIIVEENTIVGGFGSAVLEELNRKNIKADIRLVGIDDVFVEHGSPRILREQHGLTFQNIVKKAEELL
ncbi:1-deoxy-D-xylulose-5-phosphate synthase [Candidatus Woesearchaeota archaeon]|nr:1-deoxy-D-xylulose-5-phosphate synthase [Candidatus Woesearchaeota archaeon]